MFLSKTNCTKWRKNMSKKYKCQISPFPTKKYTSDFTVSNEKIHFRFHRFQWKYTCRISLFPKKLFFSTSTKLNKEKNPLELTLIMWTIFLEKKSMQSQYVTICMLYKILNIMKHITIHWLNLLSRRWFNSFSDKWSWGKLFS